MKFILAINPSREGYYCKPKCRLLQAVTLNSHDDWKKLINQARIEARRESSLNIILNQLCYKMKDFSLISCGLPTDLQEKVDKLSLEDLENLSIDSLKINSLGQLRELLSTYSI